MIFRLLAGVLILSGCASAPAPSRSALTQEPQITAPEPGEQNDAFDW